MWQPGWEGPREHGYMCMCDLINFKFILFSEASTFLKSHLNTTLSTSSAFLYVIFLLFSSKYFNMVV